MKRLLRTGFRIPRRDVTAFDDVAASVAGWPNASGACADLAAEFVRRWGYLGAFPCGSGRDGLRMLLRALRPMLPDVAWVPAWTIPAVPQIFTREGFDVRFIDTDCGTMSLTADLVERTCTSPGLLLVTHYFGLSADMGAIGRVAARRGLKIVEDCAHAAGVICQGRPAGSRGLGGFLSFETRKPLNGLGGGMVVTNSEAAFELLSRMPPGRRRGLAAYAMKLAVASSEWLMLRRPLFEIASRFLYSDQIRPAVVGLYRKMHSSSRGSEAAFSDRQARTVLAQLDGLAAAVERKRAVAAIYDRHLPASFSRPSDPADRPHGYYMYVTSHPAANLVGRRLRELGIDCGIGQEVLQMCGDPGSCPGAARLAQTAIELPMYASLTESDALAVCRAAAIAER